MSGFRLYSYWCRPDFLEIPEVNFVVVGARLPGQDNAALNCSNEIKEGSVIFLTKRGSNVSPVLSLRVWRVKIEYCLRVIVLPDDLEGILVLDVAMS